MKRRSQDAWPPLVASLTFLLVLALALQTWRLLAETLPSEQLRALRLVHRQVLEAHVEAHEPDELLVSAIEGMVAGLDRHSRFVPPREVTRFEDEEIRGTYRGIGAVLQSGVTPPTVLFPFPGGPAEAAGIEVGDRILAVDGEAIQGDDALDQQAFAIERLKGPVDEPVTVEVLRSAGAGAEGERQTIEVERGEVRTPAARWARLLDVPGDRARGALAYVWLTDFQRGVAEQFDDAWSRMRQDAEARGVAIDGLIVDLRGNPGGLLTEAVAMANRFQPTGILVKLKRRDDEIVETHEADPADCTIPDVPLVLLVDQQSASASEVVAGALQDHGRARLVGVRTYGKGVVQSIFQWRDLDFRLKLTTSHYYTPSGRNIERSLRRAGDPSAPGGIEPDVTVPVDDALRGRILTALARYEVPRQYAEAATRRVAEPLGVELPRPLSVDEDPQLAAAVAALRGAPEEGRGTDGQESGGR